MSSRAYRSLSHPSQLLTGSPHLNFDSATAAASGPIARTSKGATHPLTRSVAITRLCRTLPTDSITLCVGAPAAARQVPLGASPYCATVNQSVSPPTCTSLRDNSPRTQANSCWIRWNRNRVRLFCTSRRRHVTRVHLITDAVESSHVQVAHSAIRGLVEIY